MLGSRRSTNQTSRCIDQGEQQSGWLYQGNCVSAAGWRRPEPPGGRHQRNAPGAAARPTKAGGQQQPMAIPLRAARSAARASAGRCLPPHQAEPGRRPTSTEPVPRMWACQRCQLMPGSKPSAMPLTAARQRQRCHSIPGHSSHGGSGAWNQQRCLQQKQGGPHQPCRQPQRRSFRSPQAGHSQPSKAIADSWLPSSIARRPWRAIGSSVSSRRLVARQSLRSH